MIHKTLLLGCLIGLAALHTKDEWRSRTIYQLITDRFYRTDGSTEACADLHAYCGGTWKGIESQLDYIKGMGFDAIWISPIPENLGNDYHGYAALNWYEVNPKFGTKDDLKSMVSAAHSKGIWVMLDVVANHVAPVDLDFSQVTPFNESQYYHDKCQINNWNDQNEVETCRLSNLPDLDQNNEFVRTFLKNWVATQISTFGFDGIRVDTTPEVPKDFWKEYAASAGVFQVGEVFNGDIGYVSGYQGNALDATLNYPLYFTLKNVFDYKQSMYQIRTTLDTENSWFEDTSVLGVFIDNHDNPRFLNLYNSVTNLKSALTYALFGQGIPIVYYGTEQEFNGGNDPDNREVLWTDMNTQSEMYLHLQDLISIRKSYQVWNSAHIERYCDDTFYAFSRGNVVIAVTNQDGYNQQHRTLTYHPYSAGQKVCNLLYSGDCITISSKNEMDIYLNNGESKIFVPAEDTFLQ